MLARKDYKNYDFGGTYMGISTVFLSLETIVGEFGATYLREEFDKLMEEKGVEVYSVLTHYNDGEVRRQMLLYSKNRLWIAHPRNKSW